MARCDSSCMCRGDGLRSVGLLELGSQVYRSLRSMVLAMRPSGVCASLLDCYVPSLSPTVVSPCAWPAAQRTKEEAGSDRACRASACIEL